MKADSIKLREFLAHERRHLVPLFQRPYVWQQESEWEPLWEDVRHLAERELGDRPSRPHFLGTVVLDQVRTSARDVDARLVIDGQQRLTTLQLLFAAFRELCGAIGDQDAWRKVDRLTRNEDAPDPEGDQRFKVWPTNADRAPFRELMDASETRAEARLRRARGAAGNESLLADAYAFFHETIGAWLRETGEANLKQRVDALLGILRDRIHLVVIDLGDEDEAQLIFETLNARGAPLLPADLVKNFLFQEAQAQGAPLERLYERYWKAFDEGGAYWRKKVRQGRLTRPRIDLFLQHYLTLATRDEVPAGHLFAVFKDYALACPSLHAEDHLRALGEHAQVFQGFNESVPTTRRGVFFRRLEILETTTVLPFLLGLFHRFADRGIDAELDAILGDLESFLVRRFVCRLTTKNYNRLFLDLVGYLDELPEDPARAVRSFLLSQEAESTRWPTDEEFCLAWMKLPAYKGNNILDSPVSLSYNPGHGEQLLSRNPPGRDPLLLRSRRGAPLPGRSPLAQGRRVPRVRRSRSAVSQDPPTVEVPRVQEAVFRQGRHHL